MHCWSFTAILLNGLILAIGEVSSERVCAQPAKQVCFNNSQYLASDRLANVFGSNIEDWPSFGTRPANENYVRYHFRQDDPRTNIIFKASALRPMLSISRDVRVSVCVFV